MPVATEPVKTNPLALRVPLLQATVDFYCVLMAAPFYNVETTFEGARKVYDRVYGRVVTPFADALYDYLVCACAGEMRHARGACSSYYEGYPAKSDGDSRSLAARFALKYEPKSLLFAAAELFNTCPWRGGGVGGRKWGRIAEAGLLRPSLPPTVFIDHAVDLAHNNGTFVGKGFILDISGVGTGGYQQFLNLKAKVKDAKALVKGLAASPAYCRVVSSDVLPLIVRMAGEEALASFKPQAPWTYTPIAWGGKPFDLKRVKNGAVADEDEAPIKLGCACDVCKSKAKAAVNAGKMTLSQYAKYKTAWEAAESKTQAKAEKWIKKTAFPKAVTEQKRTIPLSAVRGQVAMGLAGNPCAQCGEPCEYNAPIVFWAQPVPNGTTTLVIHEGCEAAYTGGKVTVKTKGASNGAKAPKKAPKKAAGPAEVADDTRATDD